MNKLNKDWLACPITKEELHEENGKLSSSKYSFNDKSYSTKKVKTESEAKTYLKKLKERNSKNWEYVKVNEKTVL